MTRKHWSSVTPLPVRDQVWTGIKRCVSLSRCESSPTWLAERWPLLKTPSGSPATTKVSGQLCVYVCSADVCVCVHPCNNARRVFVFSQVTTHTSPRWPTCRRMSWSTCTCSADQWSSTTTMTSFGQKPTWTLWWAELTNQKAWRSGSLFMRGAAV